MRNARRASTIWVGLTLSLLIPLAGLAPASASDAVSADAPVAQVFTNADRAAAGAGYISLGQRKNGSIPAFSPIGSTADAVIAFVVARRGPTNIKRAMTYLIGQAKAGNIDNVGLQAKVTLAAVAAGRNPTNFGGHNLVAEITDTEQVDGRYGAFGSVFDQADAILALVGAGFQPTNASVNWLADAQCGDGGWQYDGPQGGGEDSHCLSIGDPFGDWFQADTNTSSLAVQALEAANGPNPAVDPFAFFTAIRDADYGGWGYTWGYNQTDANSTALVIQAYAAGGVPLPDGAASALRALQYGRCGAFAYGWTDASPNGVRTGPDLGATIGAVPGLLRRTLPVGTISVTQDPPAPIGCPLS